MELTFLGTGSAFAGDANNAAYILDRRVLVDAGAPVHVLIRQTGHHIAELEAAVISHQHADHTFGLPYVMATRAIEHPEASPFTIVGPPGFEDYMDRLFHMAWGAKLKGIVWDLLRPRFIEMGPADGVEVAGFRIHSENVVHVPDIPCLGYGFVKDGIRFGYSGDSGPCPGLDALVEVSDYFLIEMTGVDEDDHSHMSRAGVEALVQLNPTKTFYLTHLNRRWDPEPIPRALYAQDLQTVELPPA
jgi:ribonuclease BN (tRNA processing enzyme)